MTKLAVNTKNFLLLFFFLSNITFAIPSETALRKNWMGQWYFSAESDGDRSTLKIDNIKKEGFEFQFEATSGMKLAEMNGNAVFEESGHKAHATLPAPINPSKKCEITFTIPLEEGFESKLSVSHLLVSTNGPCEGTYNGVNFDGKYLPENQKQTYPTSFNCKEAQTQSEKAICYDKLLADADKKLSELYFPLLAAAEPFSKKETTLQKTQKEWIKRRDKECNSRKEPEDCLVKFYAERLHELQAITKNKKLGSPIIDFKDFTKATLEDSRSALWDDVLVQLIIRRYLGNEKLTSLRFHKIRLSEETSKPVNTLKEISVLANIKGGLETSGIVLTKDNELWVLLSTVEPNKKWHPLVFGPKNSKAPQPETVKNWIQEFKGRKDWIPATITYVFP